jgi:hypothetical protein
MGLQASDIADMMVHTHKEFDEMKWEDMISDYRETVALQILDSNAESGVGDKCEFYLQHSHNSSAEFTGLDATDNVTHPNVFTKGSVGWAYGRYSWSVHHALVSMNSSPAKILDYMRSQYISGLASWVVLLENKLWRSPVAGTDDPLGIPYWIVKNNTQGFNGSLPSGYTDVGGISPTTYTKWKNYTDQYAAITKDDFVRKLRRAAEMTNFKSLVSEIPTHALTKKGLYCGYPVIGTLEEILESQNDNLGNDIASRDGKVVFRGISFNRVPELEADTTNPIYMIPWGKFKVRKLKDWWNRATKIDMVPGQHNMSAEFRDFFFNTVCYSRRHCAVLATDTTMPS